jgi:Arc/MetJ-type ribon-helix-helix transcriptional regulator
MVKDRISATVDEKTIKLVDKILSKGKHRNKSHVIEEAIALLAKENENP